MTATQIETSEAVLQGPCVIYVHGGFEQEGKTISGLLTSFNPDTGIARARATDGIIYEGALTLTTPAEACLDIV